MKPIDRRPHPVWAAAIAAVVATAVAACPATGSGTPSKSGVAAPSGIEAASLQQLVRADGSIDVAGGARGSVTSGSWRMELDTDGAPRFIRDVEDAAGRARPPAGAPGIPRGWEGVAPGGGESPGPSQASDPADVNWDDRFVLPNGVDNTVRDMAVRAIAVDGRGNLYVGGRFSVAGGVLVNNVAKWDGTNWSALGTGVDNLTALAVDAAGNVYAGRGALSEDEAVLKWDGASWSPVGQGFWSRFAEVTALAVDGAGNLYAGGSDYVDFEPITLLGKWDGTSWSEVGSRIENIAAIPIGAIALDGAGGVYVGGVFRSAGGVSARNIARWNGTAWSALGSGMLDAVHALAMDGSGNLYAGGAFNTAGGVSLARWDGTSWSALGSGVSANVWSLAVDGSGNLFAGGAFTRAGDVSARGIAKWDGTSWSALGTGVGNVVHALAVDHAGHLWAGGLFGAAGTVAASHVARWDGSSWWAPGSGMGSGVGSAVWALESDGAGNVYAGGEFASAGDVVANRVARWDGTEWSALGSGIGGSFAWVACLLADGAGLLYAGGDFATAGGVSASRIARWDGTSWSALGPGMSFGYVAALASDGAPNLYAGGSFATAGGVSVGNVARWNGTSWSSLGSGTNNPVLALALDAAGNLYAGGTFTIAGGVSANRIAKWDGTRWSALGSGLNNNVYALAVDDAGNLYASGNFTIAGGVPAPGFAKWDGTSWSALGSGGPGLVHALVVDELGNLYAGVAKWDGARWTRFGSGMNDAVNAVALDRAGNVYAGGRFTAAGGKVSSHLALWRERRTIVATAGPGGTITPGGTVTVINGEDQSFAIAPDAGHHVADVRVDGNSIGPATEYTFTEVTGDHTIEASFCVGVAFELMPRDLNLQSKGRWVSGEVTLPAPYRASDVDLASIRLNDVVRVAADWSAGTEDRGSRLKLKFSRADLEATLAPGDPVPVTIGGMVAGSCFRGTDSNRVLAPGGAPCTAGQSIAAEGGAAVTGETAGDPSAGTSARGQESEPVLALRPPNPVTGPLMVRLRVSDAAAAELAVFDIRGRALARREVGPGSLGWTEVDLGELPAGVYYLRLSQAGRSVAARVVRLR